MTDLKKYTHIIWDYNGTLLDDAWLCVEVMNTMLAERNLPLRSLEGYRDIFDFPVKDYYEKLGFDFTKEDFNIVGMEFMIRYNKRQHETSLHPEVKDLLAAAQIKGYTQFILSAREEKELLSEIESFGLISYFSGIYGLDDHYAHGKTDVGFRLIHDLHADRPKIVFIGDTRHDAEVASEIGVDCVLIPNGHHSEERLLRCGVPVISSLHEIQRML